MEVNTEIIAISTAVVGIVVEAVKPLPRFNAAYAGVLALVLGALIGFGLTFEATDVSYSNGIISGVVGAATAAGLYSAVDAAKKARTANGNHVEPTWPEGAP